MALTSVYYDGTVTETQRAQNRSGSPEYGVYGPNDFKVTAHPSIAFAVLVKAGKAHGHGVTDTAAEDQVVQCASLTEGQVRWDLIVVRRNWQPNLGGPSELVAIQAGALPEIPAARKVGPGVEDDQPLYLVKWQGGTTAPVEFHDLRIWQNNGGAVAVHDTVRTFLNKVGTTININGIQWTRRFGDNYTEAWEKTEAGKTPLFGVGAAITGNPSGVTEFLVQKGSFVGKSDGAGFTRLTFPKAFPNGVLSIQLTNGDGWASGPGVTFSPAGNVTINGTSNFFGQSGYGSKTDVVYEMCGADGTKVLNRDHRISYEITGW